eukprot:scaffold37705_cov156-Skeletonema_marinoi.AAC.1
MVLRRRDAAWEPGVDSARYAILAVLVEVGCRVKSLIPRLPTTFSPNPPANPALLFGTCPKHPKHVATPSHTLSGPANQALGCVIAGYSNFNKHGEDYFPLWPRIEQLTRGAISRSAEERA